MNAPHNYHFKPHYISQGTPAARKKFMSPLSVLLLVSLLFFVRTALAEGTKEILPSAGLTSYLWINGGNSTNTGNNFGFTAQDKEKLYVHIKDYTNERIYFGFDPVTNDDIYIRIKDASGAIVYGPMLLPQTTGPGFIDTYTQAFNGPRDLTTGGYNALSFEPESNGDFSIEFNTLSPTVANTNAIYFRWYDITVGDKTTLEPIPGRLFAYMWDSPTMVLVTLPKRHFMLIQKIR